MAQAAQPIDHVAFQARRLPDKLAMADLAGGRRWSYAQLDDAIARCAGVLRREHGCGVGDRVAALARNRAELAILHFACARIGGIYAPLNWRLSPAEIVWLLDDAEPRVLFGDAELTRAGLEGVALDDLAAAIAAADPLPPEPIDQDRPSLVLYTSGTSGKPKGALISERNLAQTAINFGLLADVRIESVFLVDAPMFHIIGLISAVRPVMMHGAAVLISDGFEPARTLDRLGDPGLAVTHYFSVPQMAAMLRGHPHYDPPRLAGLTALFTGGAPHAAAAIRSWLADGIAIVDGFGMTETGCTFGMPLDRDLIAAKAGCVGFGAPGVRARIVDGDGRDCPPGVAGELLIKGENVFSGYWRRPEATAEAFTDDGWFRTGDMATCDEDGYYAIVDRKKDMYISGGENVYPAEVEAAVHGLPGLAEVAVVGVPDEKWGEVGHMAIIPRPGATIAAADVHAHLEPRLARYKLPRHITILEDFPRTGSGKVQKAHLKAVLLGEGDQ